MADHSSILAWKILWLMEPGRLPSMGSQNQTRLSDFTSTFCFLNFIIFRVAQMVKRLSAMQETWVRSLGWEDPQEKEMATYSSIFAWEISWTEEPGRL